MSTFLTVATTVWGLVMALAPVLQIRLILQTRDSSQVSLSWMFILLIGYILWFAYGIVFDTTPLIIANSVSAIVGLTLVVLVFKYRTPELAKVAQEDDGMSASTSAPASTAPGILA
ncbi:SemiSWEET family sugar transporter [Flaviflexus sp.]|uniref:SemiSWEET family sugar transporter n=1 Tax=Flaviflexus sp. TaxID=1969482 RepID=UPI003F912764